MGLDVAEHDCATAGGGQTEKRAQVGVELQDAHRGVAEIQGFEKTCGQPGDQQAQEAAFAGARFADHHSDAVCVDQKSGGGEILLYRGQKLQRFGGDLLPEGQLSQAVVAEHLFPVHERCSLEVSSSREAAKEALTGVVDGCGDWLGCFSTTNWSELKARRTRLLA